MTAHQRVHALRHAWTDAFDAPEQLIIVFERRIAINVLIDLCLQRAELASKKFERLGNGVRHRYRGIERKERLLASILLASDVLTERLATRQQCAAVGFSVCAASVGGCHGSGCSAAP